jgi:hypothetical protein
LADALAHRAASTQASGQTHSPDAGTQVFNALGLSLEKFESLLARVRGFPEIRDELMAASA